MTLQQQKQLKYAIIFWKKFISYVQNVYHRPKHMHSHDIAIVCGKSSRICCRMVFGFKLSLWNVCSIAPRTLVVKWFKIWWIWRRFILCNNGLSSENGKLSRWTRI